jgi:hypothetical protein
MNQIRINFETWAGRALVTVAGTIHSVADSDWTSVGGFRILWWTVLAAGSTTHSGKIRLRHPETVEYQHE